TLLLCFSAAGLAVAQSQQQPATYQGWVQQGIEAFQSGRYPDAVESFRQAARLNPTSAEAHIYLGTAYLNHWIPGSTSPENLTLADQARHELQQVLEYDPRNVNASSSLAFLFYYEAMSEPDPVLKVSKLDKAAEYHKQIV